MRGTPYVHGDFRGGLNTKAANYLLEDNQCRDCQNVQSTTTGAIVKRAGVTQVASQSGVTFQTLASIEATGSDHFLAATSSNLYKIDGSTVTTAGSGFSNGTWSVVEATAQDSQGPVFLSNGAVSKAWNGTTLTDWTMDGDSTLAAPGSQVTPHTMSIVHESRIVFAVGSTIYWSEIEAGVGTKPRTWLVENQQMFDPNDGDEITGLGRVGSNLIVFKKHKIFIVYDLATGSTRRLTTNIGCVSHRTIKETPFGTLFLADTGVYVTNGSAVDLISDLITPTIQGLITTSEATSDYYHNHYYLSCPASGIVLDYDLVLKSWWKHDFGVVNDFASRFNNSNEELYCVVGGKVGRMFDAGVYTDFGDPIGWYWQGPWLAPGQARSVYPAVRKRMKAIRVDGLGTAQLQVDKDFYSTDTPVTPQNPDGSVSTALFPVVAATTFGDSSFFGDEDDSTTPPTPTGPTTFGDAFGIQMARIWGQGVARSWALTFKNNSDDTTAATIQNYTIFMQERNQ